MTTVLEVRHLSRAFGGIRAVDDVSFAAQGDRITGLIGPNGAGKTTLFNLIAGTTRANTGEIGFRGRRIDGLSAPAIARAGLGRTFQMTHVFAGSSVLDNLYRAALLRRLPTPWSLVRPAMVGEGRRASRIDAERALATIGLEALADVDAGTLAYGQQKILGVGMALATRPSLLLMDEPAAGLNAVETDAIGTLIERVRGDGLAILLVEHDMNLVMRLCADLVVLVDGRVLASGPAATVRDDPRVVEAYLGADLEHA